MSWIEKLYRTYDNIAALDNSQHYKSSLAPLGFISQKAHVDIILDPVGNFLDAEIVPCVETLIPATEVSASRTSACAPHPLCDKLQYVAGDYADYGGQKPYFDGENGYLALLSGWCEKDPLLQLQAVLSYVQKRSIISDLVQSGIIDLNEQGQLLKDKQWRNEEGKTERVEQRNVLVRWRVEIPGRAASAVWEDDEVIASWRNHDQRLLRFQGEDICMVLGKPMKILTLHPRNLRRGGDGSKLLSANDEKGFIYRGRFTAPQQAYSVSYLASMKAHAALQWLIRNQGVFTKDQVTVTWALSCQAVPNILESTEQLFRHACDSEEVDDEDYTFSLDRHDDDSTDVGWAFAQRFKLYAQGYNKKLGPTDDIIVMSLDSATPGRLAIVYYRELRASEFLQRLEDWHIRYAWPARAAGRSFVGVVAPYEIVKNAYGEHVDDKLLKAAVKRILPCITEAQTFPNDIRESVIRRVSNRAAWKFEERARWQRALWVACSLWKGSYPERGYSMSLDTARTTRSYLYGRLLAVADYLEGRALYYAKEKRETNAGRLMQRFSTHPYSTWQIIAESLKPYEARMRSRASGTLFFLKQVQTEVYDLFDPEDFSSDQSLEGEYLLGYHCQLSELYKKKGYNSDDQDMDDDEIDKIMEGEV